MSKLKVLVIGSNSFSGSHFVAEALRKGHKVWGVSRSAEPKTVFLAYRWPQADSGQQLATSENFSFQAIDLNKQLPELLKLINRVQPEIVVNFAAQGMVAESWLNPTHWYRTNVLALVALHDELRRKPFLQKYLHITTPEVYGSTDGGWIKEHDHFTPSTPYAVSRAACDLHLLSFHKAYDFPVVFTRAANVYGPGQQLYRIIPRTILYARLRKKLSLHGGGSSDRSFVHMDDVSDATYRIAMNGIVGDTYHISTKETISIRDLVVKICQSIDMNFYDLVEESEERLGKDQSYMLNSDKIRKELGWKDTIDLEEGIASTIKWIERNLDTLKNLPHEYIHKA